MVRRLRSILRVVQLIIESINVDGLRGCFKKYDPSVGRRIIHVPHLNELIIISADTFRSSFARRYFFQNLMQKFIPTLYSTKEQIPGNNLFLRRLTGLRAMVQKLFLICGEVIKLRPIYPKI